MTPGQGCDAVVRMGEDSRTPALRDAVSVKPVPNTRLCTVNVDSTDPVMAFRTDMRQSLPLITKQIRTIFLWGEADPFAIPATGKGVEALLPDVKFHWVPGAGHQVQTDKPDESVKIIRDFMRS